MMMLAAGREGDDHSSSSSSLQTRVDLSRRDERDDIVFAFLDPPLQRRVTQSVPLGSLDLTCFASASASEAG